MLRQVIWGIEGSGKSSNLFLELHQENKTVLFGFKNYTLMKEQINSWSARFNIDKELFCIAGNSLNYEPALNAYTNPNQPYIIKNKVRYIFTTQAQIQKLGHLDFIRENGQPIIYDYVVIDEFDFCLGIIPSLDYQLKHLSEEIKNLTKTHILDWVYKHYTKVDARRLLINEELHLTNFNKAYWLEATKCPITFLTSEILACEFLETIGFEKKVIESPDFKNCTVNIWGSELIGRNFFNKMNTYVGWNKLSTKYQTIISDCIRSFSSDIDKEEYLDICTLSHTATRGRNDLIGQDILTVLSYIPSTALKQIQEAFIYFGKNYSYSQIEKLFYRDRLCQAIGRVIGHRGARQTDVVTHSKLLEIIKTSDNFPYDINTSWEFSFDSFDKILDKVKDAEFDRKQKANSASVKDYSFLDNYFKVDSRNNISCKEIKLFLREKGYSIPGKKVAYYFNCNVKNKRINGIQTQCVLGLNYKN